ncbi:sugar-binding transcriptional regulator [Lichenifustis flavocetrariae]|uniref:Sugar-binding transcriptional regulator n=1 Tax=Lichenifustis flavocetrariae TaxID=2949735 RepID=A0AA42CMH4_9HYPH|nr:sugar-binding transcriptional regulator [Lichenifustis flavocetrariae]MCW6508345.1 sugar-binding transcriptional regulator [Lichenifustis flavocetrariae]
MLRGTIEETAGYGVAEDYDLEQDIRTRAAWLYYMEGLTQDAVAQILGLTRARVLRMLAACREDGTVQIRVTTQMSHCTELGRRLEQRFGLERAVVIPQPQDDEKIPALIGAATGALLQDMLEDGMTVGLGWGRTLSSSLPHIQQRRFEKMTVVSLLGGLTRAALFNPSEFAWRFADRLGAECFMMAAPVYAPDTRTREALVNHSGLEDIFRHAQKLDLAIVSVGDLSPNSTLSRYDLIGREDVGSLVRGGAVGDLLCRFIDAKGKVLDHPLNDRVISATPAMLRSARKIILSSGGWEKADVIRAALLLIEPQCLVTDEHIAEVLVN